MKSFVPQEENSTLDGQQKVMYTLSDNGDFQKVNYGSSIEEFATLNAVNEYKILEQECLKEIKQGISSPIKYFMYKNRMDLVTLSSAVGMFCFRVKRHLQMKHFKKLSNKILKKYAEAFCINIEDLKDFSYE